MPVRENKRAEHSPLPTKSSHPTSPFSTPRRADVPHLPSSVSTLRVAPEERAPPLPAGASQDQKTQLLLAQDLRSKKRK